MSALSTVVTFTDDNFSSEVETFQGIVIVDFWATWCGPCKAIAPLIELVAAEYEGVVKVGKVDVDANQKTAGRFNIRSIPTLMFFKNGKPVDVVVGAVPKSQIESRIEGLLKD